jgi:hypothetical protein
MGSRASSNRRVRFDELEIVFATPKAIRVKHEGNKVWLPRDAVRLCTPPHDIGETADHVEAGDTVSFTISEDLAAEKEMV